MSDDRTPDRYEPRHARPDDDGGDDRGQTPDGHWDADEGEGDIEPFGGDPERAPSQVGEA